PWQSDSGRNSPTGMARTTQTRCATRKRSRYASTGASRTGRNSPGSSRSSRTNDSVLLLASLKEGEQEGATATSLHPPQRCFRLLGLRRYCTLLREVIRGDRAPGRGRECRLDAASENHSWLC